MHHLSCKKLFLVSSAASFLCCGFIRVEQNNLTDVSFPTCMRWIIQSEQHCSVSGGKKKIKMPVYQWRCRVSMFSVFYVVCGYDFVANNTEGWWFYCAYIWKWLRNIQSALQGWVSTELTHSLVSIALALYLKTRKCWEVGGEKNNLLRLRMFYLTWGKWSTKQKRLFPL